MIKLTKEQKERLMRVAEFLNKKGNTSLRMLAGPGDTFIGTNLKRETVFIGKELQGSVAMFPYPLDDSEQKMLPLTDSGELVDLLPQLHSVQEENTFIFHLNKPHIPKLGSNAENAGKKIAELLGMNSCIFHKPPQIPHGSFQGNKAILEPFRCTGLQPGVKRDDVGKALKYKVPAYLNATPPQ